MSTQQETFSNQRPKKANEDGKTTRKRSRSPAIHSARFEIIQQEESDKKVEKLLNQV